MTLYAERTFKIDTENAFKVGPHIVKVEKEWAPVVKLNLGEPDFPVPSHIKDEIKRQLDLDNTHYCDPQGLLSLRESIARQVSQTRKLEVGPQQVVVFPGGKPPIGLAQQVYCNQGDEVIYPSPGFPIYESFIRYVDAVPVPLHLDEASDFTFSPEQLAELITPKTKLIYLNFPSNPTGGVATRELLESIAEVILERCSEDVRVYSDEIYENILFDGLSHHSIASMPGMASRSIIASGFSKTYAWTGGRIGYAVFPNTEEAEIFKTLNINYFSCVPPYNQEAARVALENTLSKTAVGQMVQTFEKRRDEILEALNQVEGISCRKPGGAFYLFPNISEVCSKLELTEFYSALSESEKKETSPAGIFQMFALYEHQVAVLDRRSFGSLGSEGKHYLRLSTASEIEVLREGVQRLKNASEDQAGLKRFLERRPDLP
ncbi:MAG: aminotransferase class I/II-fold pyridoxal phosphate-dependent enzyme [SAR324 cluster bacterium]|jgi:aspartate/methionine/tyrosine aminotransferase|nr:aminotransferase class I/II-fold pyridoxal phosphate-dependent enzyme [SAR324 cluster bacterium]MEE1575870.1 aminotransferase class I/II-fold pyridoxal phosphate-dependent enzyme [Deltaproteobacteria bacterium]MDP6248427.1 aminotransferase class I/II-fold pyridoxal phosphate-dependent enzyme [SAR324 cluster bacterium]MDP6465126.1 aminotransferase class I/II-fold pyridoxal phosphate-dependent enzyme [SAR324 cluster bacterium]MDP7139226.1 aminotransferase class I/II-fold pyridoxal phosphate-de|tara:strand:+ start:1756 stop:3054 length:1299 start_codon:yes stop_codon:yes gene_type:complete